MKERPILFSGPMVRALLDGSKTQTRRVVKKSEQWPANAVKAVMLESRGTALAVDAQRCSYGPEIKCPYGQPGDRLWVREAWRIGAWREDDGKLAIDYLASAPEKTPWITVPEDKGIWQAEIFGKYWIQSTDDCIESNLSTDDNGRYHWEPGQSPCRKRPSIHMPRWASRITLEITAVRVERLQDISESDAMDEGLEQPTRAGIDGRKFWRDYRHSGYGSSCLATAVDSYKTLWESINNHGSWDLNPWVWVIEFKRLSS